MQHGPGTENAFGGVAQAYGDSVPIVVLPGGYPRRINQVPPNFNALLNFQHVTKSVEQVTLAAAIPEVMRRAFTQVKNGRPRPVMVEFPVDVLAEEVPEPHRLPAGATAPVRPRPARRPTAARLLVEAERPVLYAGQGVHYAKAWAQLRALAELLEAPVTTSLQGKSAFPKRTPWPSARAAAPSRSRCITSCRRPMSSSASGAASRPRTTGWPCPRASASSTPPWTRPT